MDAVAIDVSLRKPQFTALFCSAVAAVYAVAGLEPSGLVKLLVNAAPLVSVILWLQKDCRRTGTTSIQDWGMLVWLAWPVVIPWYVLQSRGRAGWALLIGLFGLILSASIARALVPWIVYVVQ